MPLQLYEKEHILDACLAVFARYGYTKTSTAMLAEAAGISKSLIFHHFKSKKGLYLSMLDQCFEKRSLERNFDKISKQGDFFTIKEKFSIIKFFYYKENPDLYKVMSEAFYATPNELKKEIKEKYGTLITNGDKVLKLLFEQVPLREGVDRAQAFKLIIIILEYFENQYLSELTPDNHWDETYLQSFLDERNRFLDMIRYGIEK